jgi:multidrug efflux pump subunit AcrB
LPAGPVDRRSQAKQTGDSQVHQRSPTLGNRIAAASIAAAIATASSAATPATASTPTAAVPALIAATITIAITVTIAIAIAITVAISETIAAILVAAMAARKHQESRWGAVQSANSQTCCCPAGEPLTESRRSETQESREGSQH